MKNIFFITLKQFRQPLLYGLIGFSALGLEMTIFYALNKFAGYGIPISNAMAMFLGLLMSFSLNARFNFRLTDKKVSRFSQYALVTLFGYFLSTGVILVLVSELGVPSLLAKIISLPAFFLFQYNCNRLITFRKPRQPHSQNAMVEEVRL